MDKFYYIYFKKNAKSYIFKGDFSLNVDDVVIVDTENGLQSGFVKSSVDKENLKININNIKNINRKADANDLKIITRNKEEALGAMNKAEKIAIDLNLSMSFVDAQFTFMKNQLVLTYIADSRVDFRELAKKLASIYKTRIELRQIGVRDKAKEVGGIGQCGRPLCCSSFLNSMETVSMNMAKNQGIALNPSKINGCCGRLMCCLSYEDSEYVKCSKGMPRVGKRVTNEHGSGYVVAVDILNRKYTMNVDGSAVEVELDNCETCKK